LQKFYVDNCQKSWAAERKQLQTAADCNLELPKHANGIPGQHLGPKLPTTTAVCWSAIKFISKVAQLLVEILVHFSCNPATASQPSQPINNSHGTKFTAIQSSCPSR